MADHRDYTEPNHAKELATDRKVPLVLTVCFSVLLAAALLFATSPGPHATATRTAMVAQGGQTDQPAVATDAILFRLLEGWGHRGDANV
jgi:hypothetical protein